MRRVCAKYRKSGGKRKCVRWSRHSFAGFETFDWLALLAAGTVVGAAAYFVVKKDGAEQASTQSPEPPAAPGSSGDGMVAPA